MARSKTTEPFHFEGFANPTTTPVPDVVFDQLLARLGEAELKALLYIIRRTFGFKRDRDPISFNQFLQGITTLDGRQLDHGCGVRSRTTLSTALKSLEQKGIILSEKGVDERGENVTTVYRLHFRSSPPEPTEVVRIAYHRSTDTVPPVVRNSYPQQTGLQQTDFNSNIRKGSPHFLDHEGSPNHDRPPSSYLSRSVRQETTPPGETTRVADAIERWQERRAQRITPNREGETPRIRPRRVKQQDEAYQTIQAYIADFGRELNDQAPLQTSTTRAYNLYRRSGLELGAFIQQLYAARAIVKERTASIQSRGETTAAGPTKRKAAYYFAVLEDLLGLRENRGDTPSSPAPDR